MLDIKFMKTNNEMFSAIFIYGVRKRCFIFGFFSFTVNNACFRQNENVLWRLYRVM